MVAASTEDLINTITSVDNVSSFKAVDFVVTFLAEEVIEPSRPLNDFVVCVSDPLNATDIGVGAKSVFSNNGIKLSIGKLGFPSSFICVKEFNCFFLFLRVFPDVIVFLDCEGNS